MALFRFKDPSFFEAAADGARDAARGLGAAHQNGGETSGLEGVRQRLLAMGAQSQDHRVGGDGLGLSGGEVLIFSGDISAKPGAASPSYLRRSVFQEF